MPNKFYRIFLHSVLLLSAFNGSEGILMALGFISVTVGISSLLQEAFGTESTIISTIHKEYGSGRDADPDFFPEYPRVTICRDPAFKTDINDSFLRLAEYASLSLGYPFMALSPEEMSMIIELARLNSSSHVTPSLNAFKMKLEGMEKHYQELKKAHANFDLRNFIIENSVRCENFFRSCVLFLENFNCNEIFEPIITSWGLCYTLKGNNKELERLFRSLDQTFMFTIDLLSPPNLNDLKAVGFNVFFTDPKSEFLLLESYRGVKVLPDTVTVIYVNLEKWNRKALYTAWHGLITNCPKFPYMSLNPTSNPERYMTDVCKIYGMFQAGRESCACESVLRISNSSMRQCDPLDEYICVVKYIMRKNLLSVMKTICPEPCILYKYKTESSYMGFGRRNNTRVQIVYNSDKFIYHQYRVSTFSSLVSQIGGSLGLYLGASIVTVIEVIVFVMSWIWYKIFPLRATKINTPPNGQHVSSTVCGCRRKAILCT